MVTEFRFSLPCRSGGGLGWGPVTEERRVSELFIVLRDADITCILHPESRRTVERAMIGHRKPEQEA